MCSGCGALLPVSPDCGDNPVCFRVPTCEEHPVSEPERGRCRTENAIITCDYCGSKVDTGKHAVCDHCGGPYWDDEEWKNIRNNKEA